MPLPKCVKVDFRDVSSAAALRSEGWRDIGVCDVWWGTPKGKFRGAKYQELPSKIIMAVEEFGFSGRLWRDPEISREDAIRETQNMMRDRMAYVIEDGFGIFSRYGEMLVCDLIGVLTPRGGIAQDIIRSAMFNEETEYFKAGTYSDNLAARRLYESLGMTLNYSNRIFHK